MNSVFYSIIILVIAAGMIVYSIVKAKKKSRQPYNYTERRELQQQEKAIRGKKVFESEQYNNPFILTAPVGKIRFHEYFISSHDDSAISVSIIGTDGCTLWKTTFVDDRENDAYALKAYLQQRFGCPVEEIQG